MQNKNSDDFKIKKLSAKDKIKRKPDLQELELILEISKSKGKITKYLSSILLEFKVLQDKITELEKIIFDLEAPLDYLK